MEEVATAMAAGTALPGLLSRVSSAVCPLSPPPWLRQVRFWCSELSFSKATLPAQSAVSDSRGPQLLHELNMESGSCAETLLRGGMNWGSCGALLSGPIACCLHCTEP